MIPGDCSNSSETEDVNDESEEVELIPDILGQQGDVYDDTDKVEQSSRITVHHGDVNDDSEEVNDRDNSQLDRNSDSCLEL